MQRLKADVSYKNKIDATSQFFSRKHAATPCREKFPVRPCSISDWYTYLFFIERVTLGTYDCITRLIIDTIQTHTWVPVNKLLVWSFPKFSTPRDLRNAEQVERGTFLFCLFTFVCVGAINRRFGVSYVPGLDRLDRKCTFVTYYGLTTQHLHTFKVVLMEKFNSINFAQSW